VLHGKKILIGVTGSIAAYKTANLVRLFKKSNADVKVLMTPSASDFITPLTLSTLSGNPVLSEFVSNDMGEWNNHVELGLWADVFIVAPASANTIAKMANGICDNLLLAVYLSARCPVYVAPAMDLDMYKHPSTVFNFKTLAKARVKILDAEFGELASGLIGTGRMAEPETIVEEIEKFFGEGLPLSGKTALVTAGPTIEMIDPVRFIGNHSSGKMGLSIARKLNEYGAKVDVILGPSSEDGGLDGIRVSRVTSADDMFAATEKAFSEADIVVLAAAVSDFKPKNPSETKIKKDDKNFILELTNTTDIAATLGKKKVNGQVIVGFALETHNELKNAEKKMREKNFDIIVLNSLQDHGAGFGHDTNKITILFKNNKTRQFELKSKTEVAKDIVDAIVEKHF